MAERILVVRFSSLGDVVLTEPVFRALQNKYPRAKIAFVTKWEYASIFQGHPALDKIFVLDGNFDGLAGEMRIFDPDLIIDLHRNFRSRKLARQFPNAETLVYPKARVERFLKVLNKSRKPVAHTLERYLKAIGSDGVLHFPLLHAPLAENERPLLQPSGFTVGLGLGAKWETKRWPVGYFARLAQLCSDSFPVARIVLFGTEEEYELGNKFKKEFSGGPTVSYVFGQPLERVKTCLSKLDLLVSNDSGLMHLGAALGVPALGLFGPTHPVLGFAPLGEKSCALTLDLYCSPCSLHGRAPCFRSRRFCLEDLAEEKVLEDVRSIFKPAKPKPVLEPAPAVFLDRDGVIIRERNFDYTPDNLEILPGAAEGIKKLKEWGFKIIVVSNQSGIGRGLLTVEGVDAVQSALQERLKKEGAEIDRFYFCPHWPEGPVGRFRKECACRKPETGMLELADLELSIDFSHSFVIGDRTTDLELGWKKRIQSILVLTGQGERAKEQLVSTGNAPVVVKKDVREAADYIVSLKKT